jgi:hypothetical protein
MEDDMEIKVIDFLELVKEELFDLYLNGIQVGEDVEYYKVRAKYYDSALPPLLDKAMRCNVIKVDFLNRRIFAEDVE